MFRFVRKIALALAFAATPALAQPAGDEDRFTPDQLRQDFLRLHETLEAAHYDLYAETARSVFDQRRDEMLAEIIEPMTRAEAMVHFQTYMALARHGHARIDFPADAWFAFRDAGGGAFPVDVRIRQGRVLVEAHQSGLDTLQPGDEILAINGAPNAIWMPHLTRHLSAETATLAHTLLESYLPALIWLEYPDATSLDLRVRHAGGEIETLRVPLLSRDVAEDLAEIRTPVFSLDGFDARMLDDDIAYLRPGAFYNTEPGGVVWDATGFIDRVDAAFESFLNADANALILDLRDNPGGDNSFSDPIIAWFADRQFHFASEFSIRVSEASTAANAARLAEYEEGVAEVSALFAELYADQETGDRVAFEIPLVDPRPGTRFEGAVYVLINRYSYSNAVTTAALIQDYGFGTIVGEATSDMSTTYGAMEYFTLPQTGIRVGYPKAHIIRPNGERRSHPVSPDIELDLPSLRGADDVALEQLLRLIQTRD